MRSEQKLFNRIFLDICFAELDLDYVEEVRRNQPVFAHRRSDLYTVHTNERIESKGKKYEKSVPEIPKFFPFRFRYIHFWRRSDQRRSMLPDQWTQFRVCQLEAHLTRT